VALFPFFPGIPVFSISRRFDQDSCETSRWPSASTASETMIQTVYLASESATSDSVFIPLIYDLFRSSW